ncbi:hypothetical protein ABH924_004637 [Arthrobacter sp. GAS37]|uniref:hypothetical protein n=1 Tax=Arthrobacter sp. GAS37 TaxID=3156261 RepID=UPI0038331AFB
MSTWLRIIPLVLLLPLGGCTAVAATQPAVSPSASSVPPAGVRQVSTPGTLVDDMKLSAGQCHIKIVDQAKGTVLPDPACTPGAVDPAVTQENLKTTICRGGYTKSVRPPAEVTNPAKTASLKAYGLPYAATTEYDHLIPLELGGASSTSNLWVEPNQAGASTVNNPKDDIENALNAAVCAGRVTLTAAQQAIASDWTTAKAKLGL